MKDKKTFEEMKQKYSTMPTDKSVYLIDGTEYTVVSHYTGNKDVDAVVHKLAEKQAYAEMHNRTEIQESA